MQATTGNEVQALAADVPAIAARVHARFGALAPADVNAQPAPGAWSAGQCLEHLIRSNSSYFPTLDAIARGGYRPSFLARLPWLSYVWGRLLLNAVKPDQPRKVRTRPRFDPALSDVRSDIVDDFVAHQAELADRMARFDDADAARIRIVSPFLSFVTYSLLDAFRIMVAHEHRHVAQAERAVERPGGRRA